MGCLKIFLVNGKTLKNIFVLGVPKLQKKISDIQKLFEVGFVKRFFFMKGEKSKLFCTGCPKSAVRGCKLTFWKNNFIGVSATKSQGISGSY